MLSATAVGNEEPVRLTVTADAATSAFLASLSSSDAVESLQFVVRLHDSADLLAALDETSSPANAADSDRDSVISFQSLMDAAADTGSQNRASGALTGSFDVLVLSAASYGADDRLNGVVTFGGTLQRYVSGESGSDGEPPQLVVKLERVLPEFPTAPFGPAPRHRPSGASNGAVETTATIATSALVSTASASVSDDAANDDSTDSRSSQAEREARQAVSLLPGNVLLLASVAEDRAGASSGRLAVGETGSSPVSEAGLSGLAALLSTFAASTQRETHEPPSSSHEPSGQTDVEPSSIANVSAEAAIDAGFRTGTLAASLPTVALQQTAVSLAGMFEDLLLMFNSLLHAVGMAVGSENSGTQPPVAPTVAPVFPGSSGSRQLVGGAHAVQTVLVDLSTNGEFQLEPFSRRENPIRELSLEFAPRHGQLLVRDLENGMLKFEAAPGFDGADSAVWRATLNDGSMIEGTLVFLVAGAGDSPAIARWRTSLGPTSAAPGFRSADAPQAVPPGARDAAFSSDDLLNRLFR